jgi:hypothetical protein
MWMASSPWRAGSLKVPRVPNTVRMRKLVNPTARRLTATPRTMASAPKETCPTARMSE